VLFRTRFTPVLAIGGLAVVAAAAALLTGLAAGGISETLSDMPPMTGRFTEVGVPGSLARRACAPAGSAGAGALPRLFRRPDLKAPDLGTLVRQILS
jgi:hypothetical protein